MLLIGAGRNAKARQDRDRMDILQLSFFAAVLTLGILNADAADCGPRLVNQLSKELSTVDWKQLAGWLDVNLGKIDGIEARCLREGGDLASCYRSSLVWHLCQSAVGTVEDLIQDIEKALKEMDKNLQASKIHQLDLGTQHDISGGVEYDDGSSTCSSDDPDCDKSSTRFNIIASTWEKREPNERELEFFKYRDSDGEMKRFRLLQQIQQKCRAIGTQLGIGKASLDSYVRKHPGEAIDLCLEVFDYWSMEGSEEYPYNWGSIVTMLEDVQMTGIGKKLKKALSSKV